MKLLTPLKAWYLRVFLPFEDPSHPLHAAEPDPVCDEISDLVDDYFDVDVMLDESRPLHRGDMVTHTRRWYSKHMPHVDFDSLPKD